MAKKNLYGKGILAGNPLKPVCIAGLIMVLLISWGLVCFGVIWRRDIPGQEETSENAFVRELREYDLFDAPKRAQEGENPEQIERRLARLQRRVRETEEQLSVLKRRRILALTDRRYIPAYAKAAREAAETFAYSAPIAAVAIDALAADDEPFSDDTLALLKNYSARVSQNRFEFLELSARILSGELENPTAAAALPVISVLLSADFSGFPDRVRTDLLTDDFLLKAVRGDTAGASARLDALLSRGRLSADAAQTGTLPGSPAPAVSASTGIAFSGAAAAPFDAGLARMGADFFYDNHNPLRAAELFLRLSGGEAGEDIARAADALVLAGDISGAQNIWRALSGEPGGTADSPPSTPAGGVQIRYRSLYNLAAASADKQEEKFWLEKSFSLRSQREQGPLDKTGIYSIIRYTRLLDDVPRGIEILEENKTQDPLLDLEQQRMKLRGWPPTRAAAEIWMLLGRHSEDEALYEWAAWYFDHQKLYGETSRLLTEAARKGMTGAWQNLHKGLALIREGKLAEGEKILEEAAVRQTDWRIPANLGRIQESRRAVSAALEYYEAAATLVKEKTAAALIQTRLSRCLEALGRTRESRRALETALELDPGNLGIRRELRRFDSR